MMLSAPLSDAMRLYIEWERRAPEALAEVREMFPPDSECFTCGQPVGTNPGLLSAEDPAAKRTSAILAPLCTDCMALPRLYRMARVNRMLKAMFGSNLGRARMLKPDELRKFVAQR
jgi:hypothetical protein